MMILNKRTMNLSKRVLDAAVSRDWNHDEQIEKHWRVFQVLNFVRGVEYTEEVEDAIHERLCILHLYRTIEKRRLNEDDRKAQKDELKRLRNRLKRADIKMSGHHPLVEADWGKPRKAQIRAEIAERERYLEAHSTPYNKANSPLNRAIPLAADLCERFDIPLTTTPRQKKNKRVTAWSALVSALIGEEFGELKDHSTTCRDWRSKLITAKK